MPLFDSDLWLLESMAAILLAPHLAGLSGTAESFLQTSPGPSIDSSSVENKTNMRAEDLNIRPDASYTTNIVFSNS